MSYKRFREDVTEHDLFHVDERGLDAVALLERFTTSNYSSGTEWVALSLLSISNLDYQDTALVDDSLTLVAETLINLSWRFFIAIELSEERNSILLAATDAASNRWVNSMLLT